MPRTKVVKKTAKKLEEEGIDKQLLISLITLKHKKLITELRTALYSKVHQSTAQLLSEIPADLLNTKLEDLKHLTSLPVNSSASINMTCKEDILNHTKSTKRPRKPLKRSSSLTDEGYLTTESSNSVDRTSHRSRVIANKKEKTTRTTRSLSRTNTALAASNFTTPVNKQTPPNAYGIVTPKCKPNTPHVLLRRPKAGEVALSFQGSPLLTAPVVTDDVANINIPLTDGTLLSLQPQKGLRLSQIPQFDDVTLKQLETLNEHIQMVLKAAQHVEKL